MNPMLPYRAVLKLCGQEMKLCGQEIPDAPYASPVKTCK
jgi:hypothetical protein